MRFELNLEAFAQPGAARNSAVISSWSRQSSIHSVEIPNAAYDLAKRLVRHARPALALVELLRGAQARANHAEANLAQLQQSARDLIALNAELRTALELARVRITTLELALGREPGE